MNPSSRRRGSIVGALCLPFAACVVWLALPPRALLAQDATPSPAGTWRAESAAATYRWRAVLRVDGPRVIGVVGSCASLPGLIEITDGRVDRDTITFKCTSPNGARTLTFIGTVRGDEIDFRWDRTGAGSVAFDEAFFGPTAPREFVARRVR